MHLLAFSLRMFSNEDVTIGSWMLAMNVYHEDNRAICDPRCTPTSIAVWDIPKCSGNTLFLEFLKTFPFSRKQLGKCIFSWGPFLAHWIIVVETQEQWIYRFLELVNGKTWSSHVTTKQYHFCSCMPLRFLSVAIISAIFISYVMEYKLINRQWQEFS
jgi:hypothetical protein